MNLGYKPDYSNCCAPVACCSEQDGKTVYPSFSVQNKSELAAACEPGKTFKAIVELRVINKEEWEAGGYQDKAGCRVEFEVVSIEPEATKPSTAVDRIKSILKES